jgi:hypothetical protein
MVLELVALFLPSQVQRSPSLDFFGVEYLVVPFATKTACTFHVNPNVLVKFKAQFFGHFVNDLCLAYRIKVVCVLLGIAFHSALKFLATFNVLSDIPQHLAKVFARCYAVFDYFLNAAAASPVAFVDSSSKVVLLALPKIA